MPGARRRVFYFLERFLAKAEGAPGVLRKEDASTRVEAPEGIRDNDL
jgi:hypothetical protein